MILKGLKKKVQASYKTLYIRDDLVEKLEQIAIENNSSFNGVVITIIEEFLQQQEEQK